MIDYSTKDDTLMRLWKQAGANKDVWGRDTLLDGDEAGDG